MASPYWIEDNVNDQVVDNSNNWVYTGAYPTITGATIAFNDNGANPDTITDSGNGFITAGFIPGQQVTITGSGSNNGVYTADTVAAGTLTLSVDDQLTNEGAGATVTTSEIDVLLEKQPPEINAKCGYHGLQTKVISNRYDVLVDHDACTASINPTTNYGASPVLGVRYDSTGPNYVYAFIKATDLTTKFPSGHTLDKAYLFIKRIYSVGFEQESEIDIARVDGADWDESTITWNNKPSSPPGSSVSLPTIMQDSWVIIDIKSWIQSWVDGGTNNYGLVLTPSTPFYDDAIKRFHSSEAANLADRPFFSLFYFPYD